MPEPPLARLRSTAGRVRERLREPAVRARLRRGLLFMGAWTVAFSLVFRPGDVLDLPAVIGLWIVLLALLSKQGYRRYLPGAALILFAFTVDPGEINRALLIAGLGATTLVAWFSTQGVARAAPIAIGVWLLALAAFTPDFATAIEQGAPLVGAALVVVSTFEMLDGRQYARVTLGVGLIVLSLSSGSQLLSVRPSVPLLLQGIGFLGPVGGTANAGFAVLTSVHVYDCDEPVRVTSVAAGTTQFWDANARRLPRESEFTFVASDAEVGDVRLARERLPHPREAPLPFVEDSSVYDEPIPARVSRGITETRISGTLVDWADTREAVVASFTADWVRTRGAGTCYVELPALTGEDVTVSTLLPERETRRLSTQLGSVTVSSYIGEVRPDLSRPPPTEVTEDGATWRCAQLRSGPRVSVPAGQSTTYRLGEYAGTETRCQALAVFAENGADTRRDVLLLLLGGVLGLAVTLVIEGVIAQRTADAGQKAAKT